MTIGSTCVLLGAMKHICAAGPGSGMNKFNIKKLRSEGRATQTAANLMLNKAKGGKKSAHEARVWVLERCEIWWNTCNVVVLKIYEAEVEKKQSQRFFC